MRLVAGLRRASRLALVAGLLGWGSPPAGAAGTGMTEAACRVPEALLDLKAPLPRTVARLSIGEPLTVVALGSSSTAGTGASDPRRTYPAQLAAALRARFPGSTIDVRNAGRGGETVGDMVARLRRDVIDHGPDLVIWQVGTNALLRGIDPPSMDRSLERGVKILRASGADIVLMNPQYAPKVIAKANYVRIVADIDAFAAAEHAGLFQRFHIMRHWFEAGQFDFTDMLSPDQLHMNDASYRCLGWLLGDAIARAVGPMRPAADRPASASRKRAMR